MRRCGGNIAGAFVSAGGRVAGETQTGYVRALHIQLIPGGLRAAATGSLRRRHPPRRRLAWLAGSVRAARMRLVVGRDRLLRDAAVAASLKTGSRESSSPSLFFFAVFADAETCPAR
jgi:hypothetical protein